MSKDKTVKLTSEQEKAIISLRKPEANLLQAIQGLKDVPAMHLRIFVREFNEKFRTVLKTRRPDPVAKERERLLVRRAEIDAKLKVNSEKKPA